MNFQSRGVLNRGRSPCQKIGSSKAEGLKNSFRIIRQSKKLSFQARQSLLKAHLIPKIGHL